MKKALFILALLCVAAATAITQAGWQASWTGDKDQIPAYYKALPPKTEKLPPVLTEQQLAAEGLNHPAVQAAYKAAARVPRIMTEQPCYCFCDRNHGHKSLHSCFEGTHGANCGTCVAEALYTYKMSKKGWTAGQIRDGIIKGEYKQIDLNHPDPVD